MYVPMTERTICFLLSDSEIFLGKKIKGFGEGKINGYGGKLEKGETPEDAAIRELEEEAGVYAHSEDLDKRAIIDFYFPFKTDFSQKVHVYFLRKWSGEPQETKEMTPVHFPINAIPYDKMWDSDKLWLPQLIEGKKLVAFFEWKEDNDTVKKHEMKEVDYFK